MKSDIWCIACILAEMYTGEMFFSTHENLEHIALIEKACGPTPLHMALRSQSPFKQCFDMASSDEACKGRGRRFGWSHLEKRKRDIINKNYDQMLTLDVKSLS